MALAQTKQMADERPKGQRVRVDEAAPSTDPDLPAFIARPRNAPAYYGFPILKDSELDGFVFGVITEPSEAEWGDAFVIAPNGSRAGIVWQLGEGAPTVVEGPSEWSWGVYGFCFKGPIENDLDLVAHLHAVLPKLKEHFREAEIACPESTRAVTSTPEG
jgi:hypothetical protein